MDPNCGAWYCAHDYAEPDEGETWEEVCARCVGVYDACCDLAVDAIIDARMEACCDR
jgi:hypothetical protein